MFAEYLSEESWRSAMPGVSVCSFARSEKTGDIPVSLAQDRAEVLFCLGGSLTLGRSSGGEIRLEPREILVLSDCSSLAACRETESLCGICISIEKSIASDSFRQCSREMGISAQPHYGLNAVMEGTEGFRLVPASPWSRAAFYALGRLPQEQQGGYCVMKTLELFYLMGAQSQQDIVTQQDPGCTQQGIASGMKQYMEEHMDEKLTITELSHRFHLSRTACKSCFRSCFGQPIHSWLLDRRMERAAELLEKTKMPILQVAQSVGYTGVSQFNVAFRQRYGKSPREYRKMSVSVVF